MNKPIFKTLAAFAVALCSTQLLATTYYWVGESGGDWRTASNWNTATDKTGSSAIPGNSDTAVFTGTTSVTTAENTNTGTIQINEGVVLTIASSVSTKDYCIYSNVTGDGKLIVNGTILRGQSSGSVTIDVPVEFSGSCTIKPSMSGVSSAGTLTFNKAITGSGTVSLAYAYSASVGTCVIFNGDMSGFTGTMTVTRGNSSDTHRLDTAAADNSQATWNLYASNAVGARFPFVTAGTYKFGSIKAYFDSSMSNAVDTTLELGALNKGSYLGGAFPADIAAAITWTGSSSTLTNECANTDSITVSNGGSVCFLSTNGIPDSLVFSSDGGFYVPNTTLFAAVTNVLSIADDKTVTATVGSYFTVALTADMLANGDWREHVTPTSSAYVWCGGESGNVNSTENWTSNGSTPSSVSTVSSVLVTNATEIIINASVNFAGACFLCDTTFSQSSGYVNMTGDIYGPGKIKCVRKKIGTSTNSSGVIFRHASTCNIYADIEATTSSVVDNSKYATVQFGANASATATYYGAISGGGKILVSEYYTSGTGTTGTTIIYGDMSEYEGLLEINLKNNSSSQFKFAEPNTVGGKVSILDNNGKTICGDAGTYTFASLYSSDSDSGNTIVGNANEITIVTGSGDSAATSINYTAGSAAWNWVKQGSYALNLNQGSFSSLGTVTVKGGTLVATTTGSMTSGTDYTVGLATSCTESGSYVYTFSPDTTSTTSVSEDGTTISIANSWINTYATDAYAASDLTAERTTGNKLTYWESYALGLTPSSEDSVPKVAQPTVGSNGVLTFSSAPTNVTVPSGVTATVTMKAYTSVDGDTEDSPAEISGDGITIVGGGSTTGSITLTPSSMTSASAKYYRYDIAISATATE